MRLYTRKDDMEIRITCAEKGSRHFSSYMYILNGVYVTADSGVRLYTRKDDVGVRLVCAGKGWYTAYCSAVSANELPTPEPLETGL